MIDRIVRIKVFRRNLPEGITCIEGTETGAGEHVYGKVDVKILALNVGPDRLFVGQYITSPKTPARFAVGDITEFID